MKRRQVLLQCSLSLEVVWLSDAVRASKPYPLKVKGNLFDDCVIVVGDQHFPAVEVQVVEPSILGR